MCLGGYVSDREKHGILLTRLRIIIILKGGGYLTRVVLEGGVWVRA